MDVERGQLKGPVAMITERRKWLLVGLLPLFALLFLGPIGTVELVIWLVLLVVWVVAFATWGGRTRRRDATEAEG